MKKHFLMLQGVNSPFFQRLGQALMHDGHDVLKVNFNCGDAWYSRGLQRIDYKGPIEELGQFYSTLIDTREITDVVLFGDRRPLHRACISVARARNLPVHVFEEGYFRPYWITLERDGVNAHSSLPRDADWYRRTAPRIPDYDNGEAFSSSFGARAWHDIAYNVAGMRNRLYFPHYRGHSPVPAWLEYPAYLRRGISLISRRRYDASQIDRIVAEKLPFWLVPLQLNTDAQIRDHSPIKDMPEFLQHVFASFSRFGNGADLMVIKNHPLDSGLINYRAVIRRLCTEYGVPCQNVIYLESGSLPILLSHARGVVTVNSTVGGSALIHNRPLFTLADPIYNLPGLTFQGRLDEFWTNPPRPDAMLFKQFRNAVIHLTQVNGGFYTRQSIDMAVRGALPRLARATHPLADY